jgi:hypothetical protein
MGAPGSPARLTGECHRCFIALMVGAPGSLSLPPRGATADVLQLSGSRSQTFWQCLPGGHYEQDIFSVKIFQVLVLLRTWRDNYHAKIFKITKRGAEELTQPAGSQPLPRWAQDPLSIPYRPGTPTYKLQVKTRSGACTHAPPHALQHRIQPPSQGALRGCLMSSGSDHPSLIGRSPAPSHVQWLWTPPPCTGGLQCAMCHTASDPASLQGRALEHRMFHGSRSCLPTRRAPMPPPHVLQFPVGLRPQA